MTRLISYKVGEEDAGTRLDTLCSEKGFYPSRSNAVRAIDAGRILVNGKLVTKRYLVEDGDTIVYEVANKVEREPLAGIDIPLAIRYEDDDLIVISKQADLVVHPAASFEGPTLVNALVYHFGRENLAHIQGDDRPGIVHRLDGDTSGLMLVAKNDEVGHALQEEIRLKTVERHYLTLVHGIISPDTGLIDAPIARHEQDRLRMTVSDSPKARSSVTTFKTLERFEPGSNDEGYTLVECKLHTGRTHQIRVHMKYINHACVGDQTYGWGPEAAQLGLKRQFLHSYYISFTHPTTGEELEFRDSLPEDLQKVYASLADRSQGKTEHGEELAELLQG